MRGKLVGNGTLASMNRITPACAGKTLVSDIVGTVQEDHPRVCGENDGQKYEYPEEVGSPPRVRGKR